MRCAAAALLTLLALVARPAGAAGETTGKAAAEPRARAVAESPAPLRVEGVPFVRQKDDFCGEACVEMASRRFGLEIDQDEVFAASGLDPAAGRGCYAADLMGAMTALGFAPGEGWHRFDAGEKEKETERAAAALEADLAAGVPSIVCMRFDETPGAPEHFRLVVGADRASGEWIYHDPALERSASLRMARGKFLALWPIEGGAGRLCTIRFACRPARLSAPPPPRGRPPAEYARHVMALKEKIARAGHRLERRREVGTADPAGPGFTIVVEPPFVVVGDLEPRAVREHARDTVRWAVTRLKAEFFDRDPTDILDIWLFRTPQSYEANSRRLFGIEPSTPFGYFSRQAGGLVMDLSTGAGTLVHEIVHPFVDADFPNCPAWLNEGLGSLFECCREKDGRIRGGLNWRLPGLQKQIAAGALPSFTRLLSLSVKEFYDGAIDHYPMARYLCLHLQERGTLATFYRAFRDGRASDPKGVAALAAALGTNDLSAAKAEWERWAGTLRFP